jgi:preprotein translocase subunit YajC
VGEPVEVHKESGNSVVVIITFVFLLILFAVITYLSIKEQKKHEPPKPKVSDITAPTDDFDL